MESSRTYPILDDPGTLLLHELEAGQDYEVVVTNGSGLYRYRMGDVVQARKTRSYIVC